MEQDITPEGLVVSRSLAEDGTTVIRELGHFGYVVYEYRLCPLPDGPGAEGLFEIDEPGAVFLIERIADLERRCSEMASTDSNHIDLQRWKRNHRAAKRRLRRWMREHDVSVLQLPPQSHALVRDVIGERNPRARGIDLEAVETNLLEDGLMDRFYDKFHDYEARKVDRVVMVVEKLPPELESLVGVNAALG